MTRTATDEKRDEKGEKKSRKRDNILRRSKKLNSITPAVSGATGFHNHSFPLDVLQNLFQKESATTRSEESEINR